VQRRYRYPGRKRRGDRKVLSGILFVLRGRPRRGPLRLYGDRAYHSRPSLSSDLADVEPPADDFAGVVESVCV